MHSFIKTYLVLVVGGIIISCEDDFDIQTRMEKVGNFHTVELNSVFDVYLVEDTVDALIIEGHEPAIRNVEFEVESDILRISNKSKVKWLKPDRNKIRLFIHSTTLREVRPNETCFITTVNPITVDDFSIVMGHTPKLSEVKLELNCRKFLYWNNHQCGGKITISGSTDHLVIYSFGLMSLDGHDLTAKNAWIENNSKGDCKVRVENWIQYSIRGVGNIYLYGNPKEVIPGEVTSSGRLIPMN